MQISVHSAPNGACIIQIDHNEKSTPATTAPRTENNDAAPLKIGDHDHKLGGKYAGISAGEDGKPDHRLALLPHKADKAMTWEEATKWAASFGDGSRLPTKREAALLYANLKDDFETSDWHWTSTPYSASIAWLQFFNYGNQTITSQSSLCLCRAVR